MVKTLNDIFLANKNRAVYLDENLSVIKVNTKAKECLEGESSVVLRSGKLMALANGTNSEINSEFQKVLTRRKHHAIFIPNIVSGLPCRLDIYPVLDPNLELRGRPVRLIVLIDRTIKPKNLRSQQFQDYYQLTKTELDLAASIFQDVPLSKHAEQKGVQVNTVRWTLGNVFSKTDVNSQSQLTNLATIFSD